LGDRREEIGGVIAIPQSVGEISYKSGAAIALSCSSSRQTLGDGLNEFEGVVTIPNLWRD